MDAESCLRALKFDNLAADQFDSTWKACFRFRLQYIKSKTTVEIMEKWPFYKTPSGYRLIDIDFKSAFENRDGLLCEWDETWEKIVSFLRMENHIKDRNVKVILENLKNNTAISENGRNAALVWALHGYLVPTSKIIKKDAATGKKNTTKFTIKDSQESAVMCLDFGRLWTSLQILWSTFYVVCGAIQLMTGIFFLISVRELHLYSILVAGGCNIIIGIAGGMVACIGVLSPKRQETLLYIAVAVLTLNTIHVVLMEWMLYMMIDLPKIYSKYPNHVLVDIACFITRIANATVLLVAFVDSQLTFCSMQTVPRPSAKKLRGSHEQVSDIEYIIPRAKPSKQQSHTVYNAYAQSWVFDAENNVAGTSQNSPYLKILQNGTTQNHTKNNTTFHNGIAKEANPIVHVEEASDDSTSNSDRKLCHMKSFSRSASPVVLSASSSQVSLNYNPPIYEYLEKLTEPKIYRSRLDTAVSSKKSDTEEVHYQAPQVISMRRVESVSPHAEKVQYASLMKELQRAISNKKEQPSSVTSPQSTSDSATGNSSRSEAKSSDTEFSKELEAALQLIQDLESPNTAETPSDIKSPLDGKDSRPLAVWKSSDASESEKTLSAVGSLVEISSPLREQCNQPELSTFKPPSTGKATSVAIVQYLDSQSTSGYSSPTHHSNGPTPPNWSTTSSINGSNTDIMQPMSFSIRNAKSTTVISLYSQPKGKSVTLVKICGDTDPVVTDVEVHSSTVITDSNSSNKNVVVTPKSNIEPISPLRSTGAVLAQQQQTGVWNVKSLLRKKKQNAVPKLCPELEGAIIKSESLAYLSEIELLARHQRNTEIQREIEERVIQQLGVPRTESNC